MASYTYKAAKGVLTSNEKYQLLTNHFMPEVGYNFPRGVNSRTFQHKWLRDYQPWLVYSIQENGGYCLPCFLFATKYRGSEPGVLVRRPLTNFNKALEILNKHTLLKISVSCEMDTHMYVTMTCKGVSW